jgi:MFS family permease
MSEQSYTAPPSAALTRSDAVQVRPAMRAAAWVLLVGGLIAFAGVSLPIVGRWADASGHPDQQVAIALSDPSQFRLAFAGMGVGFAVMGVALVMWARIVARLRGARWATVALAGGAVAGFGGVVLCFDYSIAPLVALEQTAGGGSIHAAADLIGFLGLTLGFVVLGVANWWGPAPAWAGIVFALFGLAGIAFFPAFYIFGAILFGLFCVFWFRRSWRPKVR